MADKEVRSKLILEGENRDLLATLDKSKSEFSGMVNSMQSNVGLISESFKSLGGVVGVVMGAMAAGAVVERAIEKTKEVANEVLSLKKAFGITAEEASVLRIALDDSFVSSEKAIAASDRLTRTSLNNSEAFKKLGIDVKGSDGHLKDSLTLMTEVNDYLLTLKEGKERDTAAMSVYGKGWRELSDVLRFNTAAMDEARDRAEKLNLIFGEEKLAQVKAYKMAMKDLDDVTESLQVQLGNALLPTVTELAVAFGDAGVKAANFFGDALSRGLKTTRELAINMRLIGELASIKMDGGVFYDSPEKTAELANRRAAAIAKYKEEMAALTNPSSHTPAEPEKRAGGYAPDGLGRKKSDNSDLLWAAAQAKRLEYQHSFSLQQSAIVKIGIARDQELLREDYAWGLVAEQKYLSEKLALTQKGLDEEIKLKKEEIERYQKAVKEHAGGNDPKSTTAYYEALKKRTDAETQLKELEGKLNLEQLKGRDELKKAEYERLERINETNAKLLDLAERYEDAAKARWKFEQASPKFKGLTDEEKLLKTRQAQTTIGSAQRKETQSNFYGIASANISTYGGGGYVGQMFSGQSAYNNRLAELKSLKEQELLTEAQYQQKSLQAEEQFQAQKTNMMLDAASQATSIMAKAFGDSKEAQIAALVMEKSIAVARIMISTEIAAAGVKAAYAAVPGGLAIAAAQEATIRAMSYVSMGLVLASGIVEGVQIAGKREHGGGVEAGKSYIVGEKRAEVLTMGRDPGYITPYVPSGNSANVNQVIRIDARGADAGVEAKIRSAMRQAKDQAKAEIYASMNRAGKFATASGRI